MAFHGNSLRVEEPETVKKVAVPAPEAVRRPAPVTAAKYHDDVDRLSIRSFTDSGVWLVNSVTSTPTHGLVICPSIRNKLLFLTVTGKHRLYPQWTGSVCVGSDRSVAPTVTYRRQDTTGDHTVIAQCQTGVLTHLWEHWQGTFTTTIDTNIFNKCATEASISTRLRYDLLGAVWLEYDPLRSGLKNTRFSLKWLNRCAVSIDTMGMYKVSATRQLTSTLLGFMSCTTERGPGTTSAIFGAKFITPCGNTVLGKTDVIKGDTAVSLSRTLVCGWIPTVSLHCNFLKRQFAGIGVELFRMD